MVQCEDIKKFRKRIVQDLGKTLRNEAAKPEM